MDYREETKQLLDAIHKENVLAYIWYIVADISFDLGLIPESPFENESV